MTIDASIAFFLVSLAATATPGPAILYVLSGGISSGLRGYGAATLGVLAADALYFVLSIAGLGAFLLASYRLFFLVKWLGAAYLVWLGVRLLWRAVSRQEGAVGPAADVRCQARWFSGGFMVHAANPKALLYFGSIVPQFLSPRDPILPQVAALGVIHVFTALTVMLTYGFFASRVRAFAGQRWFDPAVNGASGALMIAAGVGLAAIRRR